MKKSIEEILKNASKQADALDAKTGKIQESFASGRTNSSKPSTVAGTLRALKIIVENHTPTAYEQEQ
jgi:hypothetical protein